MNIKNFKEYMNDVGLQCIGGYSFGFILGLINCNPTYKFWLIHGVVFPSIIIITYILWLNFIKKDLSP